MINPNDIAYQDKPFEEIMEEAFWLGYKEGYQSMGARGISDYQPQHAYFDGYLAGKKDFELAQQVCLKDFPDDSNALVKVMKRAFDHWLETFE